MKKIIVITLLFMVTLNSEAQVVDNHPWCPDGATWTYQKCSSSFGSPWFNTFKYLEEEIILGRITKKIEVMDVWFVWGPEGPTGRVDDLLGYINLINSNDSIYIYNDGQFKFLYNFGAQVQDTFNIGNCQTIYTCNTNDPEYLTNDTIIVSSVGVDTYDNIQFESIDLTNQYWSLGTKILKNIGPINGFLPFPNSTDVSCGFDSFCGGLICYSDNVRGDILFDSNFNETSWLNCHYITTSVLENEIKKPLIVISPNPTNDYLDIIIKEQQDFSYIIYDLNGKIIQGESNCKIKTISMKNLKSGMYFISIRTNKEITTLKFIKN